jgi:predicted amidophosphoribosyltransferase
MKSERIKNFLLELFFPSFCVLCEKEGVYLCEDCKELIDISQRNRRIEVEGIDRIYYALTSENKYSRILMDNYIGDRPIKGLSETLSKIIKDSFSLSGTIPFDKSYVVVPLSEEREVFNRREELAKEFSKLFNLKYSKNILDNKNIILITDKLNKEEVINFIENIEDRNIILICASL